MRYVALAVRDLDKWTVIFPEFPGVVVTGVALQVVLHMAKREMGARAVILAGLGLRMPVPISVPEVVAMPEYKHAVPVILALPEPGLPAYNVVRFS